MTSNLVNQSIKKLTAHELLNLPPDDRDIMIEPWLKSGDSVLLYAPTGIGKSWMALSMAAVLAGGGSMGPWTSSGGHKVIYVDGEMNQYHLSGMLGNLLSSGAVVPENKDVLLANLEFHNRQYQETGTAFYDLFNANWQSSLLDECKAVGADVIVLDNLTTLSDSLDDENDAVKIKPLQTLFMNLKQAGIMAMLVHHSNKQGNSYRGSGALSATFEVVLQLEPPNNHRPGKAAFKVLFDKFRGRGSDAILPKVWTLDRDKGWVIEGKQALAHKDRYLTAEDEFLEALRSQQYATQEEAGRSVGHKDKWQSTRHKQALIEKGFITEDEVKRCLNAAKERRTAKTSTPAGDDLTAWNGADQLSGFELNTPF